MRRLEVAQRLQDSIKADSCLTDDDRIRLSNLEAAVARVQRLADSRLTKLRAAMKLVCCTFVIILMVMIIVQRYIMCILSNYQNK